MPLSGLASVQAAQQFAAISLAWDAFQAGEAFFQNPLVPSGLRRPPQPQPPPGSYGGYTSAAYGAASAAASAGRARAASAAAAAAAAGVAEEQLRRAAADAQRRRTQAAYAEADAARRRNAAAQARPARAGPALHTANCRSRYTIAPLTRPHASASQAAAAAAAAASPPPREAAREADWVDAVAEAWPRLGSALRQARSDPRAAAAAAASAARAATARAAARLPAVTPRAALLFALRGPTVRRPRSQLHVAAEADAAAAAAAADADPQLAAARESVRAISELLQSLNSAKPKAGAPRSSRDDGVADRARQALREARDELAAAAELVAAKHRVEALRERAEEARAAWLRGIATQVASSALWLAMLAAAAVAAMRAPAQARLRDAVSTPAVAAVAPAPKHQPVRRFPPPKPVKTQRAAQAQPDAAAQLAHETMAAAAAAALGRAAFHGAAIPPPPPPPAAPRGDDWRSVLEQSRAAVPLGSGVQWRQAGRG